VDRENGTDRRPRGAPGFADGRSAGLLDRRLRRPRQSLLRLPPGAGFANTDGGFCTNDYFVRTDLNSGDHVEFGSEFTNLSNAFYFRAEDFDGCVPATGQIDWSGSSAPAT
jgi:hypothetical protein